MCTSETKEIHDVYQQAMADLEGIHELATRAMCKSEGGSWESTFLLGLMDALDEVLCIKPVSDRSWQSMGKAVADEG